MPALILIVVIAICVYLISREIKRKKLEKEYKELEKMCFMIWDLPVGIQCRITTNI